MSLRLRAHTHLATPWYIQRGCPHLQLCPTLNAAVVNLGKRARGPLESSSDWWGAPAVASGKGTKWGGACRVWETAAGRWVAALWVAEGCATGQRPSVTRRQSFVVQKGLLGQNASTWPVIGGQCGGGVASL